LSLFAFVRRLVFQDEKEQIPMPGGA
jgi:hypothetical protein